MTGPSLVYNYGASRLRSIVKTLSDKNQAWSPGIFPVGRNKPRMSFAEKRSNVEGLLTDALA